MKLLGIFLLVLLFISVPSNSINQKEPDISEDSLKQNLGDTEYHTGDLCYFKDFYVSFLDNPALNHQARLVCIVTQRDFASNIHIEVVLPKGFELIDGTTQWQGLASPNQKITHQITIKAVETGEWVIRVWAGPSENTWLDLQNLYVKVTEASTEVSLDPYFGKTEFTEDEMLELAKCESTSDIDDRAQIEYEEEPGSESQASWIWITGTVKAIYGAQIEEIRYAKVELYDDDSGMEVYLATTYSDDYGNFSFYVENNDGPSQGGLDILVKVHCTYWRSGETDKCVYVCPYLSPISYWARFPASGCIPNVDGDVHFGDLSITDSGPWYIYRHSLGEYEFFKNLGWWQQKIKVWWPASKNEFVGGTGLYHITIKSGYEYDMDIIQHEYAHAVMWKVYGDDFPDTNFLGVNHWFNTKTDEGLLS